MSRLGTGTAAPQLSHLLLITEPKLENPNLLTGLRHLCRHLPMSISKITDLVLEVLNLVIQILNPTRRAQPLRRGRRYRIRTAQGRLRQKGQL